MIIEKIEKLEKCIKKELDLVTTYDQYVDVVSCWEAFLECSYNLEYEFFFDRLPRIPVSDKQVTPDFTAFFTKEYAMIFEISRTFPKGDVGLNKEINQLREYDNDIPVYNGKKHLKVDNYDIVLLLSGKDSFEVAQRISTYLEEGHKEFSHNFIVMEYISNYMDTTPYYYFRKIPVLQTAFTDFFPDHVSLFKMVDEHLKSITIRIEDMKEYKINGVLCNDAPPPAYLAGYMWHKIMYSYLDEEQKRLWREKNPRLIIPIEVDIDDMKAKVDKSIKNGRIRRKWIKNVFEFLIDCNVAMQKSNNVYEVGYRNLYPTLGVEYRDEFLLEKYYRKELALYFIERFCKKRFEIHEEKKGDIEQKKLNSYNIVND